MTNDEIKNKQEETLNNLKKYNKDRNTEIVDDPEEKLLDDFFEDLAKDDHFEEVMQELVEITEELGLYNDDPVVPARPTEEEIDAARKILAAFERAEKGVTAPPMQEWLDESDRLNEERGITIVPQLICQFCGNFVYLGQLHGPGYCREKIQYEQ